MNQEFTQVIEFIIELEKLKQVERKIKPVGSERFENSAEHSWQIAMLALSLIPYAETEVDPLRVVTMLLIHDVVEIDTGDKFAYNANHDDFENELKAAKRIFGMLPQPQGDQFLALWEEFEAAETADAKFAKGIDRVTPVLQNLNNNCQSWVENDVTISQVLKKNAAAENINPKLWEWVKQQVTEKGRAAGLKD